jgi:hypothetical protein
LSVEDIDAPSVASIDATASSSTTAKSDFWQRVGLWQLLKGGLTVGALGALGTVIATYFQIVSSYQDKVAALAKDDLAAATQAFTETSTLLSVPMALQVRLTYDYYSAVKEKSDTDNNGYLTTSAHAIYQTYTDSLTSLRSSRNLLGEKMELYLDWPTDSSHDRNAKLSFSTDPISTSLLDAYKFDCDKNMPTLEDGKAQTPVPDPNNSGKTLVVDWYSAKHHVLTLEYCLDVTNRDIASVNQWASKSLVDKTIKEKFTSAAKEDQIKAQLSRQILRLNAFTSLAMNRIEQFRSRYQPNGVLCNMPFVQCR